MSMIKSKFTFFQVQFKRILADASEFIEPGFCDAPKVLNAVNMILAIGKFIVSMPVRYIIDCYTIPAMARRR